MTGNATSNRVPMTQTEGKALALRSIVHTKDFFECYLPVDSACWMMDSALLEKRAKALAKDWYGHGYNQGWADAIAAASRRP